MKRIWMSSFFGILCIVAFSQSNVGIGIVNPTLARFQVNGVAGAGTTSAIFGGDGIGVSFQRNMAAIGFNQYRDNVSGNGKYIFGGPAATQTFDHTNGFMYFDIYPDGAANAVLGIGKRVMTISNTGTIGIATTPYAGGATLSVGRNGNANGAAMFSGSSFSSMFYEGVNESTFIRGGKSSSRVLINDNNYGSVLIGGGTALIGINTAFPTATLEIRQVGGKGYIIIDPDESFVNYEYHVGYYDVPPQSDLRLFRNEGVMGYFSSVQGLYGWISSDSRIKTNIKPLGSVLDKLSLLRPKEYEMKEFNEGHERTFGFIAQEVNEIYPEFVGIQHIEVDSVNHIPDLYSLDYSGFDIIAIKALQEQYTQLKALEKKNEILLRRLKELERKLEVE